MVNEKFPQVSYLVHVLLLGQWQGCEWGRPHFRKRAEMGPKWGRARKMGPAWGRKKVMFASKIKKYTVHYTKYYQP